jgi:histidinol-phosphate aminotransferase
VNVDVPVWVQALGHYQASKPIDELAHDLGLRVEDIVMLVANENPLGMSSKVREAVAKAVLQLNRYPDADAWPLKKALADHMQVPSDWIVVGNGSSELLGLAAQTVLEPGSNAVYPQYSFSLYPMVAKLCGAETREVRATEDFNADLDAMLAAIDEKTKLVFLTNPNNPTGTYLPADAIEAFLEKVPSRVLVMLDEAYIDFLEPDLRPDSVRLAQKFSNVMVARTFSKAYGLAGSRVGYAVGNPQLLELFNRTRHPFNVNDISQIAAIAALSDKAFVEETLANNRRGIKQLTQAFDEMGLPYMGLHGNFVTVKIGEHCSAVLEALFKKGIIVRKMKSYDLPEWVRVSVGTEAENNKFLSVLRAELAKLEKNS